MKSNDPLNERAIWAILKSELGLGGKEAHELSNLISPQLRRSCNSALRMDRVELRQELEAETEKKFKDREAAVKKREEAGGGLSREELIKCLADAVSEDPNKVNVQAAKLLTDLQGFGSAEQDITVNIVSYADAPDWMHVTKPEPIEPDDV